MPARRRRAIASNVVKASDLMATAGFLLARRPELGRGDTQEKAALLALYTAWREATRSMANLRLRTDALLRLRPRRRARSKR